ncbi:hypothetical protein [Actinopolymorpha sp. B9G3]|uniref:hypothetical protein n=1 Tax=Actinopolymorpha sp. B9G3 TaxID=3158970 RepID=UPI0032D93130
MTLRRLGAVAACVLLLAAIVGIHRLVPDSTQRMGPISTRGDVGELIDAGGFTVTVSKVRLTRVLAEQGFSPGPPARTDGIWVVLTATLTDDWQATAHAETFLEAADGTKYYVSERGDLSTRLTEDLSTEPGIPRRGRIVFEIPPDQLAGSVVRIGRNETISGGGRLSPEAVVDLGLDAEAARALVDDAAPKLTIGPVEYGP